ncbi:MULTISPECIES: YitT family protein [Clostridium]|uniref:YitT family protein n=1 Tax=Clostridium cibarium TaxID=2762247 RepID=A0ABR8PYM5_9CLOT|nr:MULTISPECIES: YitT family protein [Clostridium]MBD7913286.1 YitT family protein [Clostridium cibarium]
MNFIRKHNEFIVDVLIIFLGCFIASLGVNLFLIHAKLLSGGATGVALIIEYLTGFQSGYTVFILNLPLFVLSFMKLSKRFTLYSAIGMTSLSFSLIFTKQFSTLIKVDDILLYCIYGGVLCGIGYGLVFLRNGSTGGTDIITMLIRQKYSNFKIGSMGFTLNCLIVFIGALIFGIPRALYTLISIFIQGIVLNQVLTGFSSKKLMLILTEKEDIVINYIIKDLNRGVTTLPARGEFTDSDRRMLYCLVTSRQMIELKSKILSIDSKAFISILDVSEVKGRGFTNL